MSAAEKLAALEPGARAAALAALDEISRPMTNIEIDEAFDRLISRRDRRAIVRALRSHAIIAIVPPTA